jgi:hypothetical protein
MGFSAAKRTAERRTPSSSPTKASGRTPTRRSTSSRMRCTGSPASFTRSCLVEPATMMYTTHRLKWRGARHPSPCALARTMVSPALFVPPELQSPPFPAVSAGCDLRSVRCFAAHAPARTRLHAFHLRVCSRVLLQRHLQELGSDRPAGKRMVSVQFYIAHTGGPSRHRVHQPRSHKRLCGEQPHHASAYPPMHPSHPVLPPVVPCPVELRCALACVRVRVGVRAGSVRASSCTCARKLSKRFRDFSDAWGTLIYYFY